LVILHKKSVGSSLFYKSARHNQRRADKKVGSAPHLSSIDVVAVAIFVNPLCGLVVDVCVLTDESTDMLASGGGVQTTNVEPTIGFDISHGGGVGNEDDSAIIVLMDSSLCVGHSGQSSGSGNHSKISFSIWGVSPLDGIIITRTRLFVKGLG